MANNLPTEKKVMVVSMLCESMSIRGIERITGINRNTIMGLGVRMGYACGKIHDQRMRGLKCKHVEVDELWGFIGKKAKKASSTEYLTGLGDVWTFIGLDSESKVIPSYITGKRDGAHARLFMRDLESRMENCIQISTDAFPAYTEAVERAFGMNVDYGQVEKTYSVLNLNKSAASVVSLK